MYTPTLQVKANILKKSSLVYTVLHYYVTLVTHSNLQINNWNKTEMIISSCQSAAAKTAMVLVEVLY